jgi:hypothetical protein
VGNPEFGTHQRIVKLSINKLEIKRPQGLDRYAWRDRPRERDRAEGILGKIRHVTDDRAFLHDIYLHAGVEELAGPLRCGAALAGLARPYPAVALL